MLAGTVQNSKDIVVKIQVANELACPNFWDHYSLEADFSQVIGELKSVDEFYFELLINDIGTDVFIECPGPF